MADSEKPLAPEAPTFRPTKDEFADPLAYIHKIRRLAATYGICKIIPPEGWDPPCMVREGIQLNTTLQSVHKLKDRAPEPESFTRRLKLFHRQERRKYRHMQMKLQNSQDRNNLQDNPPPRLRFPPRVSITDTHGTGLDLRTLLEEVRKYRKKPGEINWEEVSINMRLYHKKNPKELAMIFELYLSKYEKKCRLHGDDFLEKFERDLVEQKRDEKQRGKSMKQVHQDTDAIECTRCGVGTYAAQMLLCDACDAGWHTFCLKPPLQRLPPSTELWFCPTCDPRSGKEFGFEAGDRFTLDEFKEYADRFKRSWFRLPQREPSIAAIEKAYWKIVNEPDRLVYVPYGSDLDTREVGSGFPNPREADHVVDKYDEYLRCPWNLNIFPELNGSLLSYLTESIKGVTVPWLYVGMLFATFCYHTEDSYMYSINYLHFGAPKIWYGTSGGLGAARFEAAMRSAAPHLFEANPGLFYHLTTMISPDELSARGAEIYRAVQKPGQYIVTFPQAYHGGFSTGFNCAEAVNFITADWIPFGRAAAARYTMHKWEPIFCHEEIILRAVFSPYFSRKTFPKEAQMFVKELKHIVDTERHHRTTLLNRVSERRRVEMREMKKLRCAECMQIPIMSAVEYVRNKDEPLIYCTKHWQAQRQNCPKTTPCALYTFTDEELMEVLWTVVAVTEHKVSKVECRKRPMIVID